jgi:hypothetical protein
MAAVLVPTVYLYSCTARPAPTPPSPLVLPAITQPIQPENGKSVNVRINDRGPFVRGRSLDLSQRAAEKIGVIHKGVARFKVSRASPPEEK